MKLHLLHCNCPLGMMVNSSRLKTHISMQNISMHRHTHMKTEMNMYKCTYSTDAHTLLLCWCAFGCTYIHTNILVQDLSRICMCMCENKEHTQSQIITVIQRMHKLHST